MKDGFDVAADIISLINIPEITGLIDGKIYADVRPSKSNKIDIVVKSLGITNAWNQAGSGTVNVYVPALSETQPDGSVQLLPDQDTLSSLCKAITPYLDTQYKPSFNTQVTAAGNLVQDTDGSWFVSITFSYYSIQTNFKNL
ncbi:hypothetical protein [Pedobacter sp. L105]|uniref:hypothetical protein n=1 Tax=Pedobacter sp. L105 TaxID=1641871 RepID=UPI00131AF0AD|nr:hypothetical protein [Pedobacter sp. L105]